ncbi:MAG: class I SAM-dependent methyltransferase [Pseudomonadota bacterium]
MPAPAASNGWEGYWHEDRLAACMPDDPSSAAHIEAAWRQFFGSLGKQNSVLDIATGNGVLLVWARQESKHHDLDLALTGIDLADIDPSRFLKEFDADLDDVRFEGKTSAEALPFKDGSFDVLVSQYGLEYAGLEPALAEAARVLKTGGRLRWLAHASDSAIVRQGRTQLQEANLLLAKGGPFARMDEFLEANTRGVKVARATRRLTEALKEAETFCREHPGARLVPQLCQGILDTANSLPRYRGEDVANWLAENRRRLQAQRARLGDLEAAALDSERRNRVAALLRCPRWEDTEFRELRVEGGEVSLGLCIEARRGESPD